MGLFVSLHVGFTEKTFLWVNHRQTFEEHCVQHEEISPYISLLRWNRLRLVLLSDTTQSACQLCSAIRGLR